MKGIVLISFCREEIFWIARREVSIVLELCGDSEHKEEATTWSTVSV
jgi:hypothetical protein